jgi:hypothetical protein
LAFHVLQFPLELVHLFEIYAHLISNLLQEGLHLLGIQTPKPIGELLLLNLKRAQ